MSNDIAEARKVLLQVVHEWWANHARPIFGSQLKAQMLQKAPTFDEKVLGFRNFASFVRDAEGLAFLFKGTTDFAVVPAQYEDALTQRVEDRIRIRADFWQAFVGFAVPNQIRAYDQATDKIIKGPQPIIPPTAIEIKPIAKEEQLAWRRTFIDSLGPESNLSSLLPNLTVDGGFRRFSEALVTRPEIRHRWHSALTHQVASVIRAWAKPLGVSDSVWLSHELTASEPADVIRKRIYELLDTIPAERLLELKIPVGWLLDAPLIEPKSRPN